MCLFHWVSLSLSPSFAIFPCCESFFFLCIPFVTSHRFDVALQLERAFVFQKSSGSQLWRRQCPQFYPFVFLLSTPISMPSVMDCPDSPQSEVSLWSWNSIVQPYLLARCCMCSQKVTRSGGIGWALENWMVRDRKSAKASEKSLKHRIRGTPWTCCKWRSARRDGKRSHRCRHLGDIFGEWWQFNLAENLIC